MKIVAIIIKEGLIITLGQWAARNELARQDGTVPHTDLLLLLAFTSVIVDHQERCAYVPIKY